MANVKKGQSVPPPQWWKHLRSWKRVFWKRQRAHDKDDLHKSTKYPLGTYWLKG